MCARLRRKLFQPIENLTELANSAVPVKGEVVGVISTQHPAHSDCRLTTSPSFLPFQYLVRFRLPGSDKSVSLSDRGYTPNNDKDESRPSWPGRSAQGKRPSAACASSFHLRCLCSLGYAHSSRVLLPLLDALLPLLRARGPRERNRITRADDEVTCHAKKRVRRSCWVAE